MTTHTDILTVARDPRNGGYETDTTAAREMVQALRATGYRARLSRTSAPGRRLVTWRQP